MWVWREGGGMVVGKERGSREKGRGMWGGESEEKASRCGVRDSTGKCKWEGVCMLLQR